MLKHSDLRAFDNFVSQGTDLNIALLDHQGYFDLLNAVTSLAARLSLPKEGESQFEATDRMLASIRGAMVDFELAFFMTPETSVQIKQWLLIGGIHTIQDAFRPQPPAPAVTATPEGEGEGEGEQAFEGDKPITREIILPSGRALKVTIKRLTWIE